jgi:transcriptional regulator with XRE-family HTH domain
MTIGERLRQERERLGLSQPKLAGLVNTTKQTVFSWESGKTAPDGFQLSTLAAAGADVLYILTGEYGGVLTHDEREMLSLFRAAPLAVKSAAVGALQGGSSATVSKTKTTTITARGGNAAGRDIIIKPRRRNAEENGGDGR